MVLIRSILVILMFASPLLAEKFPAQVKKSVTFIFSKDTNNRLVPQGTGFFVLLKAQQNTDTATFGYLVTTKTALQRTNGRFLDSVYVRINRKDGYSDTLIVQLTIAGVPRYFVHPDSTVDMAIIPAFPDINRYDVLYLPAGMIGAVDFFSRENIAEGQELFHIGMMQSHFGLFKNIPTVRFGRIVQLSNEKYVWGNFYTDFFLLETEHSTGSTGSPVYFYAESVKDSGTVVRPAKLILCGVLTGVYGPEQSDSRLVRVMPAYKLNELLNIPPVAAEREKEFERLKQNTKK